MMEKYAFNIEWSLCFRKEKYNREHDKVKDTLDCLWTKRYRDE
jgi:hypothetical protein